MQPNDQTVYLYKKSLGLANTNVNKVAGLEVYTSPLTARSANILTQTVPDLDLSNTLMTDNTWNLGSSTRKFASAYPYIAYYENVPLATMSDNPGIAFQVNGNQDLLKGALPAYKLLVGGIPTTPVYSLTVKNSAGTNINPANFMVDSDAGIVTFYNEPTVTSLLLPTISFWRYEGARLSNSLITNSISATSLDIQNGVGQTANFSTMVASTLRVTAFGTGISSLMVIEAGMNGENTTMNVSQQTFRQRGGGGGTVKYDVSLLYTGSVYGLDFVGDSRALFLGINGNVGIGTNNPGVLLDVAGAGRASSFYIANRGFTDNYVGNLVIENNLGIGCTRFTTTSQDQSISYLQSRSNFYFTPWSSQTPVMVIGTSGPNFNKVAIGKTTPSYTLDVAGSGCFQSTFNLQNLAGNNVLLQSGHQQVLLSNASEPYLFLQTISDRIRMGSWRDNFGARPFTINENGGNVGINTTSPSYQLDVAGSGRFQSNFNLQNLAGNNVLLQTGHQQVLISNALAPYMYLQTTTSGTSRIRMGAYSNVSGMPLTINESGGNVGIGNDNPQYLLDAWTGVVRTSNLILGPAVGAFYFPSKGGYANLSLTGGNSVGYLFGAAGQLGDGIHLAYNWFNDNTSNIRPNSGGGQSAISLQYGSILLRTGIGVGNEPATRMTINSDGNVGINTTSPSARLDVNGNAKISSFLVLGGATYRGDYASPTAGRVIFGDGTGWCFRFSRTSGPLTPDLVSIQDTGYVGIGTGIPSFPLDIHGSAAGPLINGRVYDQNGCNYYYQTGDNIGLRTKEAIWTENKFIVSSDQRIKKDIVEINDNEALEDLRKIEPKKYKYIDTLNRGNQQVYGFLAHQVSTIVPYTTNNQTCFIPDIYSSYTVSVTSNVSSQYVAFETSPAILSSLKLSQRLKFYDANQEFNATISSIQANNVFLEVSDQNSPQVSTFSSMVFLYGTEVNDFLTLNKDALFTLAFAATQQIDHIQQSSLQTVAILSAQLSSALGRLDAQESTIAALLAR